MASDKTKVWISFGEHGNVTDEQDWEVDEPALSKKFGEDKFYTYYAFREMENGDAYVLASNYDEREAELLSHIEDLERTDFRRRETIAAQAAEIAELSTRVKQVDCGEYAVFFHPTHAEPAEEFVKESEKQRETIDQLRAEVAELKAEKELRQLKPTEPPLGVTQRWSTNDLILWYVRAIFSRMP